jgi:uncharacterized protein (UPF0261 family)
MDTEGEMQMKEVPNILVAGILDTKGKEIQYLAERVCAAGAQATIMELSVGNEVGWADIQVSELASRVGKTKEELFALERSKAADLIAEGGKLIAGELFEQEKIQGMISFGGSMGTSIATRIMQSLPIGFPKAMLSTMASGDVRPYVGTKDIVMIYPIAEVGLNKVTTKVINNAAAAVVGMAKAVPPEASIEKPLIGCMMFGVTTPCVLRASQYFEERGYDVMINHAVGSGGRSMEELITDGFIVGMLDITTHEIGDYLLGGVLSAGPDRMTAAGETGIPQVVSVGGLDLINFGAFDTVPKKYESEMNIPGRALYVHNPTVTCIGISLDEVYQIGLHMAEKLNQAKGPTALVVPMRGWGAVDLAQPNKDLGWAGPQPGPMWISDPERPEWSQRATRYVQALREGIDPDKGNLDILLVDKHMNEPEVADLMAELLEEMLASQWKKGSHQDLAYVVPFSK